MASGANRLRFAPLRLHHHLRRGVLLAREDDAHRGRELLPEELDLRRALVAIQGAKILLVGKAAGRAPHHDEARFQTAARSEEHTSELQSPYDLVCRLL